MPLSDWEANKSVWHFMTSDWCGKAQSIGDGSAPGQLILGFIRNQVNQTMKSKPVSNILSRPLFELLTALESCPNLSS